MSYLNATTLQNFPLLNNTVIMPFSDAYSFLKSHAFVTAHNGQSILASRASKINFQQNRMAFTIDSIVPVCRIYKLKMFGVLKWIPSNHALQGLQSRRLVCHYTRTLRFTEILT